jgi:NADH:ubiquinone oxidoreductase subunit 2 (subunit N)
MLTACIFLLLFNLIENQLLTLYHKKLIYLTDLSLFSEKIKFSNLYTLGFALCFLSMGGMPPLYGFFAKVNIIINSFYNEFYKITILLIATSILSTYYYIKLLIIAFIETPQSSLSISFKEKI